MPDNEGGTFTISTLKIYLEATLAQSNERYDQRFTAFDAALAQADVRNSERFRASEVAVATALAGQERAVAAAFAAQERSVVAALIAAKEAVQKAESATEKRFDAINISLGLMARQQNSFFPRTEATTHFKSLEDQVDLLRGAIDDKLTALVDRFDDHIHVLQQTIERTTDGLVTEIASLRDSRAITTGQRQTTDRILNFAAMFVIAIAAAFVGWYLRK
jgi:hypothetical protein